MGGSPWRVSMPRGGLKAHACALPQHEPPVCLSLLLCCCSNQAGADVKLQIMHVEDAQLCSGCLGMGIIAACCIDKVASLMRQSRRQRQRRTP